MGFWITASILLFVIVMVSAFGPMVGLYGEMKYKEEEKKHDRSVG
ncbi:hypothetical protein [Ferdinandcohnia sp. Marseille-Q9671]